jgi:hypothetical protein
VRFAYPDIWGGTLRPIIIFILEGGSLDHDGEAERNAMAGSLCSGCCSGCRLQTFIRLMVARLLHTANEIIVS